MNFVVSTSFTVHIHADKFLVRAAEEQQTGRVRVVLTASLQPTLNSQSAGLNRGTWTRWYTRITHDPYTTRIGIALPIIVFTPLPHLQIVRLDQERLR